MTGLEIGLASILLIVVLIYAGLYVGVALSLVSFAVVAVLRGDAMLAVNLLTLAAADGIASQTFAVIPLFVLMGLIMSHSNVGRDAFDVADFMLRRLPGGLGLATVASNTVFAAVTGVSIASAAVFTRVALPEMLRLGYSPRFAIGAIAGSSVLGMLIPPSVLLIIYAILAEESIGRMFFAGIGPGLILASVYCVGIVGMARLTPGFAYDRTGRFRDQGVSSSDASDLSLLDVIRKAAPIVILVTVVLGGIYGGIFTPTEAGAVGALGAMVVAVLRRSLDLRAFWKVLLETGHITASVCFLIIAATMYSRALGLTGVPVAVGGFFGGLSDQLIVILLLYILLILLLGTIIDSVSILLIMVPLFLPIMAGFGVDPVWFGIITIIAVEVGLLTPPLGMACFVIRGCIDDRRITLGDIFAGALPFAGMMLVVLGLLLTWPHLVYIDRWFGF